MSKQHLKANAELVIQQLRPLSKIDFGYNAKSIEWLEGYIERLRQSGQFKADDLRQNLMGVFGSFLGQCIIECYGGYWADRDGHLGVAFDENNAVYPFNKVAKQMDNGLEEGIGTMFRCIPVLYGKSLKVPVAQDAAPPADDDLLDVLGEKTRAHHYDFAHRELPRLIWSNPELYVSIFFDLESDNELTLPVLRDFLFETWARLGDELPPEENLPADGLDVVRRNLSNGHQLVVITMPRAVQMAEAHLIAIAYRPEPSDHDKEKEVLRYFTLELGTSRQHSVCTKLCEWTRDGKHLNYADGPVAEVDAFSKAVESFLEG